MPDSSPSGGPPRHLVLVLALVVAITLAATVALPPQLAAGEASAGAIEPMPARLDLDYAEPTSSRDVYRSVADRFGFQVLFSPTLRDREITLELDGTDWRGALDAIVSTAGHFWTRVDDRTILVAEDTPQARRRYEPVAIARFSLDHAELKDVMTVVRSLVGAKHVAANEDSQTLMVRDTVATIEVVRALLAEVDQPHDEVEIAVELLRLRPEDLHNLRANGPDVDREALAGLLDRGRAESFLRTSLGLRGHEHERVETRSRIDASRTLEFSTLVSGRLDRASREVFLDLESSIASISDDTNGDGAPEVLASQKLSSSWRVAEGATLLVELAGGPYGGEATGQRADSVVALALTPTITRLGTATDYASFVIGTESNIGLDADVEGADQPAAREALRERLRERLRQLPPGLQGGDGELVDRR